MEIQGINYIADAMEAKEIDRISIQEIGIPSVVLMEKAAMALAGCVMAQGTPQKDRILAVCGTGNNAGDGVAAARLLSEAGYETAVLLVGQKEKHSVEMKRQLEIAGRMGLPMIAAETVTGEKLAKYTIIIDALFGVGLSREVTGIYRHWIDWINASQAWVVAADIPSGIHAGTGAVLGTAVRADMTVTFGLNKRGLVLYPGTLYAGNVVVADIGFPKQAVCRTAPAAYTYAPECISDWLPKRSARSNKGTYGRVLIIAGSPQMSGACYFAAAAAYRTGAGLVQVLTAPDQAGVIRTRLPEAIVSTWRDVEGEQGEQWLKQTLEHVSAVVIGPGLGMSSEAQRLMDLVLADAVWNVDSETSCTPVVIDADGLNILAQREKAFRTDSEGRTTSLPNHVILTPHLKEMSRLLQTEVETLRDRMIETVYERQDHSTIVLKDARTVVSDARKIYINTTGNSALAKGGSGDVLSGMIGGLLAQGLAPMEAAPLAVCLHGMCADAYVQRNGVHTMLASDILQELPAVMKGETS